MSQDSQEIKMVEHLKRIIDNLNQYWHSIELLLSYVSKPLLIDDGGLATVLRQMTEKLQNTCLYIERLDHTQTFGEIKYIGNRLKKIECDIEEIKNNGIKKDIHLSLTCDGYEMVKKERNGKKDIFDDIIPEKFDPDGNMVKLLDTIFDREKSVLCKRYGLLGGKEKTYEKVGEELGISSERARQICAKALRKLRHPSRKHLVDSVAHVKLRKAILGN